MLLDCHRHRRDAGSLGGRAAGPTDNPRAGGRGNARNRGPLEVQGFVVEPRAVSETVEVPGTLLPAEETQIRSELSGRVV